jgi:hypothetical protein
VSADLPVAELMGLQTLDPVALGRLPASQMPIRLAIAAQILAAERTRREPDPYDYTEPGNAARWALVEADALLAAYCCPDPVQPDEMTAPTTDQPLPF